MSSGNWKELYDAAFAGDLELVRYHLQTGADVNHIHPEYACTVLVASVLAGHEDVAHLLLDHGALPDQFSALDGLTPLQAARQKQMDTLVQRLQALGACEDAVVAPSLASRPWSWWQWLRV